MNSPPDKARRRLLGLLAAAPLLYPPQGLAQQARVLSRGMPAWAPSAGHVVSISYPAGQHLLGRGATLAEISPAYQEWNPTKPSVALYGNRWYGWHSYYGYCGCAFNGDTRQIVLYNAGHASINVCAPSCFDLNDLRWKWLDIPLPFDANAAAVNAKVPQPMSVEQYQQFYPPEQVDYLWGEVQGDWSGWPSGFGRPGKVQPIPTHTLGTLVHIPGTTYGNVKGAMLYHGRATGLFAGTLSVASHLYDFDTNSWSRTRNKYSTSGISSRGCVFDSQSGKAVAFGNGVNPSSTYHIFDAATKLWMTRTATVAVATSTDHPGNVLHEASRLHIVPAPRDALGAPSSLAVAYQFWAASFDAIVGRGAFFPVQLSISVKGGWPLNDLGHNRYIGWAYCPEDKCLYAINGTHNSNKYWRLVPPVGAVSQSDYLTGTWTLTEHTFTSGAIQSPGKYTSRSMMYNRLSWDQVSRSFIWFPDDVNGPVQAFRPEALA